MWSAGRGTGSVGSGLGAAGGVQGQTRQVGRVRSKKFQALFGVSRDEERTHEGIVHTKWRLALGLGRGAAAGGDSCADAPSPIDCLAALHKVLVKQLALDDLAEGGRART